MKKNQLAPALKFASSLFLAISLLTACDRNSGIPDGPPEPSGQNQACSGQIEEVKLQAQIAAPNNPNNNHDLFDIPRDVLDGSPIGVIEDILGGYCGPQSQDLIFTSSVLAPLNQSGFQIDQAVLVLNLKNKLQHNYRDYSLSINGLSASSQAGSPLFYHDAGDSDLVIRLNLNALTLNGGTTFVSFLQKVLKNQGTLKFSVFGPDVDIVAGELDVLGPNDIACIPVPQPPQAPVTTIDSVTPPGPIVNVSSIGFAFHANQVNVSYSCILDGQAAAACTSPQTYSNISNGNHTFSVYATNTAGLSDVNPPSYSWAVNTTKPLVTIIPQATLTNKNFINLAFTTNEVAATQCSLDGGTFVSCVSPVSYTGLSEGAHVIAITAADSAGNTSPSPATFAWTIDLTPPVTAITSVTPAQNPTNSTQISFVFGANETSTFQCALDNASLQNCSSPMAYSSLTQGTHTFQVQATDLAGNVGNIASYSWVIDLTPPVITIGNVVPAQGPTNSHNVSVEFTANKPATFTCSLDSQAASACTSPFASAISTAGNNNLVIVATDLAGNVSQPAQVQWTMDYTTPAISFGTITPTAGQYVNSNQMSFQIIATETLTFQAMLDGTALAVAGSPINLSGLAEGAHTLSVTGVDYVGNPANTITHSFITDTVPPVVTATATYSGITTNQTSNTITFSASETATFTCQLDGAGYSACTSPNTISGLGNGSHAFDIQATDLAGNISAVVEIDWAVDTTTPTTQLTALQTAAAAMQFTFTSSKPNSTFMCALDAAQAQACTSPLSMTGLAVGAHSFTVKATDALGNADPVGATAQFTILPPVNTQITKVTPGTTPTNQTNFSFTFTSNNPNATFQCSMDGQKPAACSSPANYTALSNGQHIFLVQAIDTFGGVDPVGASYQFTIDTTLPVVTLTPQNVKALSNISTASFTFTSSKMPATFQCSLNGAVYAACQSPMNLTNLANGNQSFQVTATDSLGNISAPAGFTWTINITPPTTTLTAQQTSATSMTFSFTASEAGSVFQCSFNGAAAQSCSTPDVLTNLAPGTYTFMVQAIDPYGNIDPTGASDTFTILPPVDTQITAVTPNTTPTNQVNFTFSFTSNHPEAAFQCTIDSQAPVTCASPTNYAALANGNHVFLVQAIDGFGNIDATGASYQFTIDTVLPVVTLTPINVKTLTAATSASFSFTSSKANSIFHCSLDGAAYAACQSPTSLNGLAAGNHVYYVIAIDPVGNVSAPASFSWTIDLTPPTTTVTSQQTSANSVTLTLGSSEAGSVFQCSLNGATAQSCSTPDVLSNLTAGTYTFKAQAIDSLGNVDPTGATVTFTIYPPIATILDSQTPAGSTVEQNSISFAFHANQPNATFQCTLDGTAKTCSSPVSYASLNDGTHVFLVQAIDPWGNLDPTGAGATFNVNTQPPTTGLSVTLNSLQSYTFTLSSDETANYLCKLDSASLDSCLSVVNYTSLSFGVHTFFAQAVNQAGVVDPVGVTYTFNVNPECGVLLPVISAVTVTSPTTGSATVTWQTDLASSTQVIYTLLPSGTAVSSTENFNLVNSHSVTLTGLTSGSSYSIQTQSTNCAGTTTSPATTWSAP